MLQKMLLAKPFFEPLHEIQKKIRQKAFFYSIMKMAIRKNIHNLSQGPPNPGFMQKKEQKGDFLKKPSRELKFHELFIAILQITFT